MTVAITNCVVLLGFGLIASLVFCIINLDGSSFGHLHAQLDSATVDCIQTEDAHELFDVFATALSNFEEARIDLKESGASDWTLRIDKLAKLAEIVGWKRLIARAKGSTDCDFLLVCFFRVASGTDERSGRVARCVKARQSKERQ